MKRLLYVCALICATGTPSFAVTPPITFSSGSNFITSPLSSSDPTVVVANGTANVSVFSTVTGNGGGMTDKPALLAQGNASISVVGGTLSAQGSGAFGIQPRAGIQLEQNSSLLFVSGLIEESGSGISLDRAGILAKGNSLSTILGGSIKVHGSGVDSNTFGIDALENSQVSILGGSIFTRLDGDLALDLFSQNNARITIFGTNFNFPAGPISPLSGTLRGNLQDGSSINWTFMRDSTASITLVSSVPAPEPASCLLMSIGVATGLFWLKRKQS